MELPPIQLKPPLKLAWSLEHGLTDLAVSTRNATYAVLTGGKYGLAAVSSTGDMLWKTHARGMLFGPQLTPEGDLLVREAGARGGLRLLEGKTGNLLWRYDGELGVRLLEGKEPLCVGVESVRRRRDRLFVATLPPAFVTLWERTFEAVDSGAVPIPIMLGPTNGRSVFVLDRSRPTRPAILALDVQKGQEQWRAEGSALPVSPRGDADWRPALAAGHRFLYRSDQGLGCVDDRTGSALWKATTPAESTVYRDVVVATRERGVWVRSAVTGRLVRKGDLTKALAARHPSNRLTIGCAISETHVFVCDEMGTLWALERASLEPVWSHCPAGTVGGLNSPQIVGRRLYAHTVSWQRSVPNHLYCWGPAKEGESPGPKAPDVVVTEGELPFVIVEAMSRRQITKMSPFHETGGRFTVYRCRLADSGAELLFADHVGGGGGLLHGAAEALWVANVEQGEALLRAFRQSMPPDRRMKKAGAPVGVNPPTLFKGVDLRGPGAKQGRHLTSLDGEAELVVEWDTKTKKGLIREKDDLFREGVLKVVADLLARK